MRSRLDAALAWLAAIDPDQRERCLRHLRGGDVRALAWAWASHALDGQVAPEGDWRVWLLLAGRGFGKTRTGGEWVLGLARDHPGARIALIGATVEDVDRVMVNGESGIRACAPPGEEPTWVRTLGLLRFASGAEAQAFSGANGDGLRGPQHHFAWADELGKWRDAEATWDNLMLGMRLGTRPRTLITTTPGNGKLLTRIKGEPGVVVRRGRTRDNLHLPPAFIAAVEAAYRGSRLGRQELDGEELDEADGALWPRDLLDKCRAEPREWAFKRVVVGVDPPASRTGDACGIVVCGLLEDGRAVVLADASCRGKSPTGWARRAAAAAEAWGAERVVAEVNNGGEMVAEVLRSVAPGLPVKQVRASRGKAARAEPVAALFEVGKCVLAGLFAELEDELAGFTAGGYAGSGSPDRADAMVWALNELMLGGGGVPRIAGL